MYQSKGVTFDAAPSQRETDENGFLHVGASHITKATVNPYYGREIPGWQEAGLDPEAVYYGLRTRKNFKHRLRHGRLPLHIEHHIDSAEEPQKLTRVGAVGTGAVWNPPYVDAPLTCGIGPPSTPSKTVPSGNSPAPTATTRISRRAATRAPPTISSCGTSEATTSRWSKKGGPGRTWWWRILIQLQRKKERLWASSGNGGELRMATLRWNSRKSNPHRASRTLRISF